MGTCITSTVGAEQDCQDGSAARQQQPACQIIEDGDVLAVSLRDWNRQSHHLAAVWLVIWTAGCVALAWKAATDGDPQAALVCIPMWTSWIYVAGIVLERVEKALAEKNIKIVYKMSI